MTYQEQNKGESMDKKVYIYTGKLSLEQQEEIRQKISNKHIEKIRFTQDNWIEMIPTTSTPNALFYGSLDLLELKIKYGLAYIEGETGIRYPIEMIPPKEHELLRQEIAYENANFSLEQFYQEKRDRAVCVITPQETLTAYTWCDHGTGALQIYNMLYQEQKERWDSPLWQLGATARGNVVLQLCDEEFIPVWFPYKINDYQYQQLNKIIDNLQEINQQGNYGIELTLDLDSETPIENAKQKLNEVCLEKGIYTPPIKREASMH